MVKPNDSRHAHQTYPTDGALNMFFSLTQAKYF